MPPGRHRPAYITGLLIALDQGLNSALWPLFNQIARLRGLPPLFGWPDETLSSVLGKLRDGHGCHVCRVICRVLTWFDWTSDDHCRDAIEWDEGKR